MEIIIALRQRTYFTIAVVAAVFMFFFLPYVQTLGLQTDLWYQIIPPIQLALFVVFVALFGAFVSFIIYRYRGPKVCDIKSTSGGGIGAAFAFIVGVCPGCIGFAGLLLPIGVVSTLAIYGPIFLLLSIALMLFSIHMNGGFKTKKKL
ncbi:MAG: hypothetical protein ABIJ92_02020 [Candidatus Aenigmatarchaeota archaeon]